VWAELEDLSTSFAVDLNSYDPATHMIHISLTLLRPDNFPKDALERPNWLATTTIDLEPTDYPKAWCVVVGAIPVSLKTILKTCDSNMHTVLTDALLGTKVVNVEDVGTHLHSAMVASWVGNTTREANFLSPGAEVKVKLLPKDEYGVGARPGGEKRVKKLGFKATYVIPNLPLYWYEIAKFQWVPARNDPEDGYYEGVTRIRTGEGQYTYTRVSLLQKTMEKLFGKEDVSEYIIALKTKSTVNMFMTQYCFVNIPPGDSHETLRVEKRALANQALLAAEAEERKHAALHPTRHRLWWPRHRRRSWLSTRRRLRNYARPFGSSTAKPRP
jgi:hypothetical protein